MLIKKKCSSILPILVPFANKSVDFDNLSSVYVRQSLATTQGADISRVANKTYSKEIFEVIIDTKGWGKKKQKFFVKKLFNKNEAEYDLIGGSLQTAIEKVALHNNLPNPNFLDKGQVIEIPKNVESLKLFMEQATPKKNKWLKIEVNILFTSFFYLI